MHLYEIANYKDFFPNCFSDKSINKKDLFLLFYDSYALRCKIAHIRGNFTSLDLDKLVEITQEIVSHIGTFADEFKSFITELQFHPENITIIETPISFMTEQCTVNIPSNMPTPDYEFEGGFVGRENDIKQIRKLLEGDLHRVITISGAGGVGKTALASKVIQEILKSGRSDFDSIIWLSAKETQLSYLGIEDIEPTVKNYEELLDTILEVTGFDNSNASIEEKENDVQIIFDACKCILIVIDNLETITDTDIKNFILDCHKNVKILITSRKGLGQVNRIYELRELQQKEAIRLFRLVSRDKKQDNLAKLDDNTIQKYVKKYHIIHLRLNG